MAQSIALSAPRILASVLVGLCGLTSAAQAALPDELALGLSKLHWNMSPQETKTQYPSLTGKTAVPGIFPLTNLPTLYLDKYSYAGCEFEGALRFNDEKLISVELTQTGQAGAVSPCRAQIEAEFSQQYGVPITHEPANPIHVLPVAGQPWHPFDGYYGRYEGPITQADYSFVHGGVNVSFSDAADPRPDLIIYDMAPSVK